MLRVYRLFTELRVRLRVRVYGHLRRVLQLYRVLRVRGVLLGVYRVLLLRGLLRVFRVLRQLLRPVLQLLRLLRVLLGVPGPV